jgi:hypothetical protein
LLAAKGRLERHLIFPASSKVTDAASAGSGLVASEGSDQLQQGFLVAFW